MEIDSTSSEVPGGQRFITTISVETSREFASLAQRIHKLYVLAWLIEQKRLDDAQEYNETRDSKYEDECGLGLNHDDLDMSVDPPRRRVTLKIPTNHSPLLVAVVDDALKKNLA